MYRSILWRTILLGALAVLVCRPRLRDRHCLAPRSDNVIEAVRPPHGGSYIINGANFHRKFRGCAHLVMPAIGSRYWPAIGTVAVSRLCFRNATHRGACQMWCGPAW